jgi:hypothetical protein
MADDVDIFEEQETVEEPGVLEKIDEFLKKDIRVKPEFWGQRELTDWEKHRTAKDARQTLEGGVAEGIADMFESAANPVKKIAGEKWEPGTFAELDEVIADPESSTGERVSAYAQSVPRLLLNITEGLFGHTAEHFRKRSDRYKEGMTTDEIVQAEVSDMNEAMGGALTSEDFKDIGLKSKVTELPWKKMLTVGGTFLTEFLPILEPLWLSTGYGVKGMINYFRNPKHPMRGNVINTLASTANINKEELERMADYIAEQSKSHEGPQTIEPTGEVDEIIKGWMDDNEDIVLYGKDTTPDVKGPGGMAFGGDPEELSSGIAGDKPYFDLKDLDLDISPFESPQDLDMFEEAMKQYPEEVQVANLLGKVPIWGVAGVEKAKILAQNLSKAEKSILRTISEKLGIKTKPVKETVEDIDILDPEAIATTTAVKKKPLKPISDSPEKAESMFYSNVEAKMMDPNTPETFATTDDLFKFLNQRGISKPELEDNILSRYVAMAEKNGTPLIKSEMLEIIRQSPMRKVETVNYGWLGEKQAKYADSNMETGFIPGTYRESVLYLDPKHIPLDPGKLSTFEGPTHGFSERYVIGWSRLSDRMAKLPVEKGIPMAIDPKKVKSLSTNLKKIERQIIGLESSAARKLQREGAAIFDDVDNMSPVDIRNNLKHYEEKLKEIDEPLYNQILQFRNKIDADTIQLNKMKAATKGEEIRVTFADEIQSDVLQNAKRMEEKFKEALGDLIDKNKIFREQEITRQTRGYGGRFENMNPEVMEYFIKNKTVFRPIFQTAQEMQMFMDEFAKTQQIFTELAAAGKWPSKELMKRAEAARVTETKLLGELEKSLTQESMKLLQPNIPFKDRAQWGEVLIKRDLHQAAERLFVEKADDAATMYVLSPGKPISERYWSGTNYGGTHTPHAQRTKDMKGIGMEEFYGGPNSMAPKTWQIVQGEGKNKKIIKGKFKTKDEARAEWSQMEDRGSLKIEDDQKHYTSVLEKALRRAALENNSEVVTVKVKMGNKWVDAFGIKLTPEMLLPHKTHRKDGGMVYTPEMIDIFEAA